MVGELTFSRYLEKDEARKKLRNSAAIERTYLRVREIKRQNSIQSILLLLLTLDAGFTTSRTYLIRLRKIPNWNFHIPRCITAI